VLTQHVTKEFIYQQLETLTPEGLLEVAQFIEFLQFRVQQPAQMVNSGEHTAFGVWADYPEAQDASAFAAKLRQIIEASQDAQPKPLG